MAWALGLPELASHNLFIKDLEELGYHVGFVGGYLVIYGLPYLDQDGALQHGDWACPLDLNEAVIDVPKHHQAWWRGIRPHDRSKRQLSLGAAPHSVTVAPDLVMDFAFSFKLLNENGDKREYLSSRRKPGPTWTRSPRPLWPPSRMRRPCAALRSTRPRKTAPSLPRHHVGQLPHERHLSPPSW